MVLYRAYIYCACPLIVLNIPLDSATATHMSSDSHGPVAPVTTLIQGRAEGDGVEAGVCHVPLSYLTIGDRRRRPVRRRTVVQDLAPGERHRVYVSTGPQLLLAAWRQIHSARFSRPGTSYTVPGRYPQTPAGAATVYSGSAGRKGTVRGTVGLPGGMSA